VRTAGRYDPAGTQPIIELYMATLMCESNAGHISTAQYSALMDTPSSKFSEIA